MKHGRGARFSVPGGTSVPPMSRSRREAESQRNFLFEDRVAPSPAAYLSGRRMATRDLALVQELAECPVSASEHTFSRKSLRLDGSISGYDANGSDVSSPAGSSRSGCIGAMPRPRRRALRLARIRRDEQSRARVAAPAAIRRSGDAVVEGNYGQASQSGSGARRPAILAGGILRSPGSGCAGIRSDSSLYREQSRESRLGDRRGSIPLVQCMGSAKGAFLAPPFQGVTRKFRAARAPVLREFLQSGRRSEVRRGTLKRAPLQPRRRSYAAL
jgi:hypothetical protein